MAICISRSMQSAISRAASGTSASSFRRTNLYRRSRRFTRGKARRDATPRIIFSILKGTASTSFSICGRSGELRRPPYWRLYGGYVEPALSTGAFFLHRSLLIGAGLVAGKSSARHLDEECRLDALLLRQGQAALRKERAGYGDYPDPQQPSACRPYLRRPGLHHQHRTGHRSHQQRHAVERRGRRLPRPAFLSLEQAAQCQGARRKKDIGVAHRLRESSQRRDDARKGRRRFQEGHVDSDRKHGLEYGGARKG